MVIQIEEAKERFKDVSGKFTPDMLWKYRQKIQECIDDCMRARKADTTYMKPILRQAKCHERLADFTAACACYTTVVSSSKASEKEKEEARRLHHPGLPRAAPANAAALLARSQLVSEYPYDAAVDSKANASCSL